MATQQWNIFDPAFGGGPTPAAQGATVTGITHSGSLPAGVTVTLDDPTSGDITIETDATFTAFGIKLSCTFTVSYWVESSACPCPPDDVVACFMFEEDACIAKDFTLGDDCASVGTDCFSITIMGNPIDFVSVQWTLQSNTDPDIISTNNPTPSAFFNSGSFCPTPDDPNDPFVPGHDYTFTVTAVDDCGNTITKSVVCDSLWQVGILCGGCLFPEEVQFEIFGMSDVTHVDNNGASITHFLSQLNGQVITLTNLTLTAAGCCYSVTPANAPVYEAVTNNLPAVFVVGEPNGQPFDMSGNNAQLCWSNGSWAFDLEFLAPNPPSSWSVQTDTVAVAQPCAEVIDPGAALGNQSTNLTQGGSQSAFAVISQLNVGFL